MLQNSSVFLAASPAIEGKRQRSTGHIAQPRLALVNRRVTDVFRNRLFVPPYWIEEAHKRRLPRISEEGSWSMVK